MISNFKAFLRRMTALSVIVAAGVAAHAATASQQQGKAINGISQLNPTTVELSLADGKRLTVDFYGENIFRLFRDDEGGILRNPVAEPPAEILVKQPRRNPGKLDVSEDAGTVSVATPQIRLSWNKADGLLTVTDLRTGKSVMHETAPVKFEKGKTALTLAAAPDEYFYGGGVQNGRF